VKITKKDLIEVSKIFLSPIPLVFLFMVFLFGQTAECFSGTTSLIVCIFMYLSFFGWIISINHLITMHRLDRIEEKLKNG
jgi:hypothetical protein